jgi:hypothetical protein
MKCDFCGEEYHYTEMLGYPHKMVDAMASAGYVPSGFKRMVSLIGSNREPASYFRDVVSRYSSTDEWGLCYFCRTEMQQYAQKLMGLL